MGIRWASNVLALVAAIVAIAGGAFVLVLGIRQGADAMEIVRDITAVDEVSSEDVDPSGVQQVVDAMAALDVSSEPVLAAEALERTLCDPLPTDPVASVALAVGGGRTQAVIMAMPAGAGTWTASSIVNSMSGCLGTPGEPPTDWMPTWGAVSHALDSNTAVWSRGDLVVVAAGEAEDVLALDQALTSALGAVACADLRPESDDHFENPRVAGAGYRHPTRTASVEAAVMQPQSEGAPLAVPTTEDVPSAGRAVVLPTVPSGRTYWPTLPTPVEMPHLSLPGPQPSSTVNVEVRIEDAVGPGCGWAFFAMAPPLTTAATQQEEQDLLDAARVEREGDLVVWAHRVEQFWSDRDDYLPAVADYSQYRDDVQQVSESWSKVVAPMWDAYDASLVKWQKARDALAKWTVDRKVAETDWQQLLDECEDANTAGATADPVVPPTQCDDITKPPILDEEPPAVPDKPEPPVEPTEPQ